MSLIGSYTHNYKEYPNAKFKIMSVRNEVDKAEVIYGVWTDTDTYDADKLANEKAVKPIDTVVYLVKGSDFDTNFNVTELDKVGKNPWASSYDVTKTKTDIRGVDFTKLTDQ